MFSWGQRKGALGANELITYLFYRCNETTKKLYDDHGDTYSVYRPYENSFSGL